MNKTILFYLFGFLCFLTRAQVVFCPQGAHWSAGFNTGGFPPSLSKEYLVEVFYDGDKVLGSDSVKVLSSTQFFLSGENNNFSELYIKQKGDTIFMNNDYTKNKWQIMFNYAALPGNKWYNTLYPRASMDTLTAISYTNTVVSSTTVLINGYTLKQLVVEQKNNGPQSFDNYLNYTLTERLGSDHFVFSFAGTANADGPYFGENICYGDDTFGYYYYKSNTCELTVGIEKNKETAGDIKLYPNPVNANGDLRISAADADYIFKIFNCLGEEIKTGALKINSNEGSLNLQNLKAGIYFLNIKNANKRDLKTEQLRFVKVD